MAVMMQFALYDAKGARITGGSTFLPEYLDWMPITAKAEWFKYMGEGHPETKFALLISQGQEQLVWDITLDNPDYQTHKQKEQEVEAHIQSYIDREGISRDPRNQ